MKTAVLKQFIKLIYKLNADEIITIMIYFYATQPINS